MASTPTTNQAYAVQADDTKAVKDQSDGSHEDGLHGSWRVGFCDGCCDSCTACIIPWSMPCCGIGQAAHSVWGEGAAMVSALYFGGLLAGVYVTNILYKMNGTTVTDTATYSEYYDAFLRTTFGQWDHTYTTSTSYTLLIVGLVLATLYVLSLGLFRFLFRRRLSLPGSCLFDLAASVCLSCCVVAQMRTHVVRAKCQPKDTLAAFDAQT
jgi:Cys-rich protein (TIGR01571 family)